MLAHETYNLALLNREIDSDKLIELAQENIVVNKNEEFLVLYESINLSNRLTLDMGIQNSGQALFKKNSLSKFSLAASTIKKALDVLVKKGVLIKTGSEYLFQDPFFERWLRARI